VGTRADIGILNRILLNKRKVFLKNFVWSCYSTKLRSLLIGSALMDRARWV